MSEHDTSIMLTTIRIHTQTGWHYEVVDQYDEGIELQYHEDGDCLDRMVIPFNADARSIAEALTRIADEKDRRGGM